MNTPKILLLCIASACHTAVGQVFPLSENSWSNPEFVERFRGSYGMDTERTPSITTEEKVVFDAIAPIIGTNPSMAIQQIEASITPESSAALIYTLGNLYLQNGDNEKALSNYNLAIKKFPNFLRAYQNLGIAYVQSGDYKKALTMLLKAVELGASGDTVYGLLGYAYMNLSNPSAALQAYEQALFFKPGSLDWRNGKVQALSNMGRSSEVIAMIDQMIVEYPSNTDLLMLQAKAFIALEKPEDAAATLEILRAKGKATSFALMLLGDIYLNFQQADLAYDVYKDATKAEGLGTDRLLRIARRLASAGAWEQVDEFTSLVQGISTGFTDKEGLELLNLQAQSDLAQSRNEEAAEKLTQVVGRDPLNGGALLLLANYYWKTNDLERAEIYFDRAMKIPEFEEKACVDRARMLVSMREYEKALTYLDRAQNMNPQTHIADYRDRIASAIKATVR
jgi:tetratricopeptide (TPR) repeat protein